MATLQEYKCPCCGGAIAFDSTAQKMVCPYCDTEFEMEALASYDDVLKGETADSMEWETKAGNEWTEGETEGLLEYVCKSCGGVIVGEETTGATSCPYCGNPVVMMGQFAGALKPDYVIPFKLDKDDAIKALAEEFRYSDPVSNEAIADVEADLASAVDLLQAAYIDGDQEAMAQLCRKVSATLAERNRLCKLHKD